MRRFFRHPVQMAIQAVSLAVGLAACVSAYVAVDAMAFGPTPGIADRVHLFRVTWAAAPELLSPRELDAGRAAFSEVFDRVALEGLVNAPADGPHGPFTAHIAFVSPRYFETLGTRPQSGRLLTPSDATGGATPPVIISNGLWQRVFENAPIDGRQRLRIAGFDATVVGVAPQGFAGLQPRDPFSPAAIGTDIWIPQSAGEAWHLTPSVQTPWLRVAGRLSGSQGLGAAQRRMSAAAVAMAQADVTPRDRSMYVYAAGRSWSDDVVVAGETTLLFLFIPLCVLGIGCANTINLQLARAHERAPELSIRLALGASRVRLIGLLVADAAVVAVLSSVGAMIATEWLIAGAGSTLVVPLTVGPAALVLVCLLATAIVIAAGVLPAIVAVRAVTGPGRQTSSDGPRHQRFRYALVGVQVAVSTALLLVTVLGTRSLSATIVRPGPAADRTAMFAIPTEDGRGLPVVRRTLGAELLRRAASDPEIEGIGLADFDVRPNGLRVERADGATALRGVLGGRVSAGWLATTGGRVLSGRNLTEADRGVAVVTPALAQAIAPDHEVVLGVGATAVRLSIVGVIDEPLIRTDLPLLLLPLRADEATPRTMLIRGRTLTEATAAARRLVSASAPSVSVDGIVPLASAIDAATGGISSVIRAGAIASAAALVMAAIGLFAMMTYTVERRTREIGIRLAVGATRGAVVRVVLSSAARTFAIGATVGLAAGAAIGAELESELGGVSALELRTLVPAVTLLAFFAVAGTAMPALAASRVDPLRALRAE